MKILFTIIYLSFFLSFVSSAQEIQTVYANRFDVRDDSVFNAIITPDKRDSVRYNFFIHPKGNFSGKRVRRYKDFFYNRCKVYMQDSVLGQPPSDDDTITEWRPLFSNSFVSNDTLFVIINSGLVLDSYESLVIKIYKDTFNFQYSIFYSPGDWGISFLKNENDTEYNCIAQPGTKYQYLLLKNKPVFSSHHQLTGYLSFSTDAFLERTLYDKLEKHIVFGRLFFTCKTKLMPLRKKDE